MSNDIYSSNVLNVSTAREEVCRVKLAVSTEESHNWPSHQASDWECQTANTLSRVFSELTLLVWWQKGRLNC